MPLSSYKFRLKCLVLHVAPHENGLKTVMFMNIFVLLDIKSEEKEIYNFSTS